MSEFITADNPKIQFRFFFVIVSVWMIHIELD